MDVELTGYIGAILLAVCAFPQMVVSIIDGHSRGLSQYFLLTWYLGELLMLAFCVQTIGMVGPLFWNYLINVLMLTVIVRYKYWERK